MVVPLDGADGRLKRRATGVVLTVPALLCEENGSWG